MEASATQTTAAPGEHAKATIADQGAKDTGRSSNRQHDPGENNGTFYRQKRRAEGASAAFGTGGEALGSSAGVTLSTAGDSESRRVFAPKGTVGGREAGARVGAVTGVSPPTDVSVLGDPQKAFGYFRDRHAGKTALEENKTLLGQKYARAKVSDDKFDYWGNGVMAGMGH